MASVPNIGWLIEPVAQHEAISFDRSLVGYPVAEITWPDGFSEWWPKPAPGVVVRRNAEGIGYMILGDEVM